VIPRAALPLEFRSFCRDPFVLQCLDARASLIVTVQTERNAPSNSEFSRSKCEKTRANGEFYGLEIGIEKVAAHETFAELLRLYR